MDEIRDLEKRIEELQKIKRQHLEEQERESLEKFKKLEWMKETSAYLSINAFLASGIDRYTITLHGPIPTFQYNTHIPIYKTICFINYGQGFMMRQNNSPALVTSNSDDLIEFLSKNRFRSFSFNMEEAKLYNFLYNMER